VSTKDASRLLAALSGDIEQVPPSLEVLCRRTADLLFVSNVSFVLMGGGSTPSATSAVGKEAHTLQDLEFTLGEGPGIDAYIQGRPILVDDVRSAGLWPVFTQTALDCGVRAIYALPLQVGAIKLGVLALYCEETGAMSVDDLTEAVLVADLLTKLVLAVQATATGEALAWPLDVSDYQAVVHQATGMVSIQLNCGVEDALVRLRGHAFATGRSIGEVAGDVVARHLRFDEL
jgi:hypothetical protein